MADLADFDEQITPPLAQPLWNGFYTLRCPDGSHLTFRIQTKMTGERRRVISQLIGPENTTDYESFGWVEDDGIHVWSRWQKTKRQEYARILVLLHEGCEADGYELLLSKRCFVCNRQLTDPVSIDLGVGPTCRSRQGKTA